MIGRIDNVRFGRVHGWFVGATESSAPVIVSNERVLALRWPLERPDVNAALGLDGDFGFVADLAGTQAGDSITLFGHDDAEWQMLFQTTASADYWPRDLASALPAVARVSCDPRAVAVVAWDASHNSVGRAMALCDVVAESRPVVLVAPTMSRDRVWEPLLAASYPVLTFPWTARGAVFGQLRRHNVEFGTVWLSKERLPALEVGAALAGEGTRWIWDTDDLESAMPDASSKFFGPGGNAFRSLVKWSRSEATRTTVTPVLEESGEAPQIHHARSPYHTSPPSRRVDESGILVVGFAGSAKRHKGLLEVAKAIRIHALGGGSNVRLVVAGDLGDSSHAEALESCGVETRGGLTPQELDEFILSCDVMITGFPVRGGSDAAQIADHQVPAKIGDALRLGRSVLVPRTPSTEGLASWDGVYLFDALSFSSALELALSSECPRGLPDELSVAANNQRLEQILRGQIVPSERLGMIRRASVAVDEPQRQMFSRDASGTAAEASTGRFVLFWKQPDSALYGRRVDVIARDLRRRHPGSEVVIVEIVHPEDVKRHVASEMVSSSDSGLILQGIERKEALGVIDGVQHRVVRIESISETRRAIGNLIVHEGWLAEDTQVILFPLIHGLAGWVDLFDDYRVAVDIVDNQFSWKGGAPNGAKLMEYVRAISSADVVFFNSEENAEHFSQLVPRSFASRFTVVPNWYSLPEGASPIRSRLGSRPPRVIYSGNLDDRVDWQVLRQIAASGNFEVHVLGPCARAAADLRRLLEETATVYHGPRPERYLLEVLKASDLAVIPHRVDDVSRFMNPMKVAMYNAIGVPVVSAQIPGVASAHLAQPPMTGDELAQWVVHAWGTDAALRRQLLDSARSQFRQGSIDEYLSLMDGASLLVQ